MTEVAIEQETLHSFRIGSHFEITPKGLVIVGQPSFDECEGLWETLLTTEKTIQFAIGDAMKYFRTRFGEKADQIISDRVGWTRETLRNYEWVAERVAPDVRRLDKLSFSHHQKVAKQSPKVQSKWLNKAADDEHPWTVRRLENEIKSDGNLEVLAHYLLVNCKSETDREKLSKELESRGYACKATERRGERKETT